MTLELMDKKKKIIATLGPSSLKKDIVRKMDSLGVEIFRINLSHIEIRDFEKIIYKVRSWTEKQICPDTEGAQLRTGLIAGHSIKLSRYSNVKFVGPNVSSKKDSFPLSIP